MHIQVFFRTEILLNDLQLEKKEHKLDLVKNKYSKAYQLYNKENEPQNTNYNRYLASQKPFSSKLNSDMNDNLARALTRVGLKTTAAKLHTGVPYPRHNIDRGVTRKLAHMR